MDKQVFLDYLREQFDDYQATPVSRMSEHAEKKQFINGLMTASRFFDVSYEELQALAPKEVEGKTDFLDIPTYVRNGKTLDNL